MKQCSNCVMLETRPRITFDENGVCNGCRWAQEKKNLDWSSRWQELIRICDEHRNPKGFDCIVPASGGKDSSYVAWKLKHELNMHPLTVTVSIPLPLEIGDANLVNFIEHGFDNIKISPNPLIMKELNRIGLIEQGRPLWGWMLALQTSIFRLASMLNIPLIFYGEEGESEYGGTDKLKHTPFYDVDYGISVYLSGNNPTQYIDRFGEKELYWWTYPEDTSKLRVAHWSYFENWVPHEHYLLARDKIGMKELSTRSPGTYCNYAQNDTSLYALHCYFMFLKFGFGRTSQDVGIDIRSGAISREEGLILVDKYDDEKPNIKQFLDYYNMSEEEFEDVIDKHANKDILTKVNGKWVLRG